MYPVVDFRLFFNNIAEKYSVTSVHMTGHNIEVPIPRIASENILMRATGTDMEKQMHTKCILLVFLI